MPHLTRVYFDSNADLNASTTTLTDTTAFNSRTDLSASIVGSANSLYQPRLQQQLPQLPPPQQQQWQWPPVQLQRLSSTDSFQTSVDNAAVDSADRAALRPPNYEQWSWSTTIWSMVALILCPACIYLTLISLIANVFAYVDHKTGKYREKLTKLRLSLVLSTISVIVGFVTTVIVLVVLFGVVGIQNQ